MIRLLTRGFWIVVFATLIVLASTFHAINPAEYKVSFEKLVSDKLGRDVKVERAGLEWGLPPRIVLHNVQIADRGVARNGRGEAVQAQRVVAELDMIPLTYGRVVAPRVRLENVELALQTGGRGAAGAGATGGGGAAAAPAFGSMLSTLGPALGVGALAISGLSVVMRDGSGAGTTVVDLGGTVIRGGGGKSEGDETQRGGDGGGGGGKKPGC
ncbi:MAG: AsmA family protein [Alphaproteobacteria bacterium]|nr:AsmA family protein [Alphaproteobacteria bacterium]